jgi:hypothetical protein
MLPRQMTDVQIEEQKGVEKVILRNIDAIETH